MGFQKGLAAALAARGLTVEVVPGWQTRGSSSFAPRGAVCHWTAGAAHGDRPSLGVVTNGRAGLPGPLANVFLARSGVAIVVAAGRANHAGGGGWRGLVGNSSVFGTEAESTGGGDWTAAQRWAYPRINAAYCDLGGFGPDMVCGHNEWAPTRKIDIRDWDMPAMRAQVAAVLSGAATDNEKEGFLMGLSDEDQQNIYKAVARIDELVAKINSEIVTPAKLPARVWGVKAKHPLTGKDERAIDFLRYAPAFADATQAVVENVVAAIPGVDPKTVQDAVTQALKGAKITFTVED
jgi:hypothetical protein